jgi:hypothetical protein
MPTTKRAQWTMIEHIRRCSARYRLAPGPGVATLRAGASRKRARGYASRHDGREWRMSRGLLSLAIV